MADFKSILDSFDAPFLLAPMAGFTDSAFRYLCGRQGAAMCVSEMLSAKGLFYGGHGADTILKIRDGEVPLSVQLFGHEPNMFAFAADKISSLPYAAVDINMGCPVPKVVKNGEGSALLKTPQIAADCVREAVKWAKKPVTVKIRKGFANVPGPDEISIITYARMMEDAGASAIAVHGRTREMYYSGKADWDVIKQIKQSVSIPVIGNGDVFSAEDGLRMLDYTGCDAVMVGRGALGNPWIFRELKAAYKNQQIPQKPDAKQVTDAIILHLNLLIEDKGEYTALREMRKHAGYYTKGFRGSSELRRRINTVTSVPEFLEVLSCMDH